MTFVKGKSGNPLGRPKEANEVRNYARRFCNEALDTLLSLMRSSPDERTRKSAADSILDRAIGKPSQAVEVSGPEGGPVQHSNINTPSQETIEQWIARKANPNSDHVQ